MRDPEREALRPKSLEKARQGPGKISEGAVYEWALCELAYVARGQRHDVQGLW